MQVFDGPASVPAGFGPSAVTVGKFDGLHVGHREVIADLIELAGDALVPTVVTFDRNPLEVLNPDASPPALVGSVQKLELLEQAGVQAALVLHFDEALASLEPEAFLRDVLCGPLHATALLVGSDFRFGHRGAGDVALLERLAPELGFTVRVLPKLQEQGRPVSSTWIRELLAAGGIEEAARLLGRDPAVRGTVVHGAHRGRELGFPTANLAEESAGLIPADGVYAGWLIDHAADGRIRYPAAISVGSNPTFEGVPPKQVEAYVLDRTLDLYGHTVDVVFSRRIRGQVAYAGIEPLIAQIGADVDQARQILLEGQ
jgi:riboflavin kinase / FMN adenylyltransferase